jgi:antitoxin ParD1/3/4
VELLVKKLSITVTDEHARLLQDEVAKGRFASASELVREALRSFEREALEFEENIESIRERVRRSLADSRPSISSDEVRRRLDELHVGVTSNRKNRA